MEIVKKAEAILADCPDILLASVSEEGYPRICVLSKIKAEGIRKIWCATGLSGTKSQHFLKNPKAGVCIWKGGDSITITGKVAVKTDQPTKDACWVDWFVDHFSGPTDPNYCVLEFTAEEATFWIEGEFVTLDSSAF